MQRLHPLPTPAPFPAQGSPSVGLTIVDEDFYLPTASRPVAPAAKAPPLSAMPSAVPRVTAQALNGSDDPFDDGLAAPGQPELDFGPRLNYLPRFVPLQPESFVTGRDPWSVHSVMDLLRLYLPEVSISCGLISIAGVLSGQLIHHYIYSIKVPWVVATYLALYLINLASLYLGAKSKPSVQVKGKFRGMLLGCFILCIPHLVASAIVKAAG